MVGFAFWAEVSAYRFAECEFVRVGYKLPVLAHSEAPVLLTQCSLGSRLQISAPF